MKNKLLLLGILITLSYNLFGQNLQLHYDFGKADNGTENADRGYFTTTLEMFKIDTLGSTFLFVDMDYDDESGMSFAYWEIFRTFNIPKVKFVKLEFGFNDGMFIPAAWLAGVNFPIQFANFNCSASAFYRAERYAESADFQITGVWFANFLKGRITFTGFADFWSMDDFNDLGEREGKRMGFLTEPQLWFNINKSFSIGSELEISKNLFTFDDEFEFMPTLGVKWTFH